MTITSRPARRFGTLKEATRRLIEACGGLDGAAESCRVGRSCLSDNQNEERHESYLAADCIAQLEAACGRPIVTEHLASRHRGVLVTLPDAPADLTTWMQTEAAVMKAHAERAVVMADSLADGKLTLAEASDCLRAADAALRELALLRELLRLHIERQTAHAA
jgi:hypothetical protein